MARVAWKGAISFGLVHIPVRLYTAVHEKGIHFHLLSPDGLSRVRRKLVRPDTDEEVAFAQTTRGYEIAPDRYVVVTPEEIAALRPEKGRAIEIEDFVSLDEIDPVYFTSTYWAGPGEGGGRAYRLLVEALERAKRVGIARFVLRDREHLCAVRATSGALALSTMHWPDEVDPVASVVGAVPAAVADPRQVDLALELVDRLTRAFDPSHYPDTHRRRVQDLIERKAGGEQLPIAAEPVEPAPAADLMEALRQSLRQSERKLEPT